MPSHFDTLLLLARPAAGKSEIIHYLKSIPLAERLGRFHVGQIYQIDDFPMIWAWFEEDDILSRLGHPRLHSDEQGFFLDNTYWDVLIERIGLEYAKLRRDLDPSGQATMLVEFARGREHGGFQRAFAHLSPELLSRAAILYINVSYAESLRKNRQRSNPERPDSLLQHSLEDEKMERLYKDSDWEQLTGGLPLGWLEIQGQRVPYVVFENEDDLTTPGGEPLALRLQETLGILWQLYANL